MVPRENCRKVSKNFLTLFDDFWRLLPCAKIVEQCRKTFWHFLTWPLSASPFCNPLNFGPDYVVKYGQYSDNMERWSNAQTKAKITWRMAKGGAQKGGFENALFNLKNPWKIPENTLIFESRNFQAFFMAPLPRKMHEKCLKNAWKMPEKPLIQKSGCFQIPPFMPPPFAILWITRFCRKCCDRWDDLKKFGTEKPWQPDMWQDSTLFPSWAMAIFPALCPK